MNRGGGVAGIVLCGGRSARMGRPKAWLEIGGETLLARTVRVVSEVASEVVVVAAAGQELPQLPAGVRVVCDSRPDRGPLEGIAAGLAAVTAEVAVIVPCDLPRLTADALHELLAGRGAAAGCVPVLDGQPRPLPGVYCRTVLETVQQLLTTERRAVRGLLGPEIVLHTPTDPAAFRGANTPAEWAATVCRLPETARGKAGTDG